MIIKKTIIDISYLVHWNGRLTGIPRVINELSVRYNKQENVAFVIWDGRAQQFYETELIPALKTRGEFIHYKTKEGFLYKLADRLIRFLGFGVIARIVEKVSKKFKIRFLMGASKILIKARYSTKVKYYAKTNDVFVITMGDWQSRSYINTIKKLRQKNVKLIQFCYDMLPIVTPQYSGHATKTMTKYNLAIFPIVDKILSISEHTKRDVVQWLEAQNLHVPAIDVFRLGDDFDVIKQKTLSKRLDDKLALQKKKYILCVGTIEARKNHALLYYVYKLAKARKIELPQLIVVGRIGWQGDGAFDLMTKDPEVNQSIKVVKNATDQELAWLYENAMFSVYPSFYEGWGLPIAESIAHGITCLTSNSSSMPEIAGDLIDYFNPVSPEDCLEKILKLVDTEYMKSSLTRIKSFKKTTWEETYNQVDNYVKELYV